MSSPIAVGLAALLCGCPVITDGMVQDKVDPSAGEDQDEDGYRVSDNDCDDLNPDINPGAIDNVGDGSDQNCDGIDGTDGDGDGHASVYSGGDDCADDEPSGTLISEDADCDGVLTAEDCDDSDDSMPVDDMDCDGALTADDCDDEDASSTSVATDADCDGVLTADDCNDADAASTTVATDADCDGTLTADDCNDGDANSTTVATDADCDGSLTGIDCDDTSASNYPGNQESCDGLDNDCSGIADEGLLGSGALCASTNCQAILDDGSSTGDGSYWLDPYGTGAFSVTCDMTTDGGGWTSMTGDVLSALAGSSGNLQYLYSTSSGWITSPVTTQVWDWNTWVVLNGDYDYGPAGSAATGTFSCTHTNVEYGDYGFGCVQSGGPSGWKVMPAGTSANYDTTAGTCLVCQDNPGTLGSGCAADVQISVRELGVSTCTDGSSSSCASTSCKAILDEGSSTGDGSYWIDPDGSGAFSVTCDMTTDGGGWTAMTSDMLSTLSSSNPDRQYLYSTSSGWITSPVTTQVWDWNTWVVLNGDYDYGPAGSAATGTFSCTHTNVEYGDYGFGCVQSGGPSGWKVMPAGTSANYDTTAGTCLVCQDNPGTLGSGCAADVQISVREWS